MITIRPSTVDDIYSLVKTLRQGELKELEAFAATPQEALLYTFETSLYCNTVLINDEVAAIAGVKGNLFGLVGNPFLMTGEKSLSVSPLKFTRVYLSQLETMKTLFPVLENFVDSEYYEAIRLLKLAGFTVSKPFSVNGKMIRKFSLDE